MFLNNISKLYNVKNFKKRTRDILSRDGNFNNFNVCNVK